MAKDKWAEAHDRLVSALENAQDAGVTKDEAQSALDDVYLEDRAAYRSGGPKNKDKNG